MRMLIGIACALENGRRKERLREAFHLESEWIVVEWNS
jgi:hypothetical protein